MASSDALDTNLLRTKGGGKAAASAEAALDPIALSQLRRKKILKGLAYAVFFLWSLVTFTMLKIPDSVVANLLLNTLNQNTPYNWQAEKIGIGFFPWPHLTMEKLDLAPKFAGGGPDMRIDEIRVYPNPFALIPLGGAPAFGGSFRAEAYKTVVKGSFGTGHDLSLHVTTDSIDLGRIPPLAAAMDLKGNVTALDFRIYLPGQRVGIADGEVVLKAKNVALDPSSFGLPIVLPLLNLGDVDVEGTLRQGALKIEKFKVGGAGKDLDIQIPSGTVNLSDVTPNTRYDLHVLLKPSAAMKAAVPGIDGMLGMWATVKPDGAYAVHVQGTLASPMPAISKD
jgi:type II secretion system protein N